MKIIASICSKCEIKPDVNGGQAERNMCNCKTHSDTLINEV